MKPETLLSIVRRPIVASSLEVGKRVVFGIDGI